MSIVISTFITTFLEIFMWHVHHYLFLFSTRSTTVIEPL